MRHLFVFALLMFTVAGICQPAKDSLLVKDYKRVEERLRLMHYLDHFTIIYFTQNPEAGKVGKEANFINHYDTLIGGNAALSAAVSEYLGYSTDNVPHNFPKFMELVFDKNIRSLISITEKYGYPSSKRIKISFEENKNYSHTTFALRTNKEDKKLRKLLKSEIKEGNLPAAEYEMFMSFINNRQQSFK